MRTASDYRTEMRAPIDAECVPAKRDPAFMYNLQYRPPADACDELLGEEAVPGRMVGDAKPVCCVTGTTTDRGRDPAIFL